ncbi:MAG: ATP-binding protein [Legionellaceae bacterium]|nr:ATP-binding protein [Legionellaceae bacterium]
MKQLGIKYQLRIITLIPVLLVALLCAVFYNYQYNHDLQLHELFSPIHVQSMSDSLGWLSLELDNNFILLKRYHMYIVTIGITLFCLLVAFSIHYILSRKIYRPIAQLRRSMNQILQNEFETKIKVSSAGELGIIERGCAHLQQHYLDITHELNQHIEVATIDLQQSLELLEEKNIELSLEKKKIKEKHRQKSEFIANMSHEIRTPMNGVIGFTNVLLETNLDTIQLDYVKTIKSSAQDLLVIINDILDYSKIDAGKLHLDCIPLNIRACIDEVLALIAPNAHQKGIDLIPITAIDVPKTILGDPWRIKQIITNLVSNAVKFTDHGYVLIRTEIEEESNTNYTLRISVSDTGIGMSPDTQATLFTAFTQADTTTTRRYGGSGLGLIICKRLVEHMQGHIAIHSESHKGTTFTVHLKLAKLAAYEIEKHQVNPLSSVNILCFDDNPLHLEALCNGLGYLGIHCIPVHSFDQLDNAFLAHPDCQLAFVNVNPNCEQQIARIVHKQTIPCILVSKSFIQNYQALGAQGLLFKPPNLQKLHQVIESVGLNARKKEFTSNEMRPYEHVNPIFNHTPADWFNQQRHADKLSLSDDATSTSFLNKEDAHNQTLYHLRKQLQQKQASILIAEDNLVSRMLLKSLLSESAQVDTVNDGEETILASNRKKYSAILLDLQMPKRNGLEAAQFIRNESILNQRTPIILISANGHDYQQSTLQNVGINLCLQKPIDERYLLHHLLQLIDKTMNPAINWSLCVKKASGNHDLAVEFLAGFVEELQLNRIEFLELYQQNDRIELERIAHKLHGACCFCGVSTLQSHVANLENRVLHVRHVDELHDVFLKLIEEIDAVLTEYKTLYRTKIYCASSIRIE